MRFLAALALLWATSTRATSISRADQASLVQQLVRDNRGGDSVSFDEASLATAVARTAMNHSYPLIMQDSRKRAVFLHMMTRITKLVGAAGQSGAQRHNARDMQSYLLHEYTWKVAAICMSTTGLSLGDFGLNLANTIATINGCAGEGQCLTRNWLGLLGEVGDLMVDLFNLEQNCGKPFLNELLDCSTELEGYFGMTPLQKSIPSFIAQRLTWAMAGAAGIWGAFETCKSGAGASTGPVNPFVLIPTAAASFLLSGAELSELPGFEGTNGEEAGRWELCGARASVASDALGLFAKVMTSVAHVMHGDGSDAKKGFLPYCFGAVADAVNTLPDIVGKYCSYESCQAKFPGAEVKEAIIEEAILAPIEDVKETISGISGGGSAEDSASTEAA